MEFKINQEQRLFVIPAGEGCTCLGFDVCAKWTKALFDELNREISKRRLTPLVWLPCEKGTREAYDYYQILLNTARDWNHVAGYRFQYELEPRLMGLEGKRVEVKDKDGNKRRFIVGKSTGFIPVHLEIANRRSSGGPAVCLLPTDTIKVVS